MAVDRDSIAYRRITYTVVTARALSTGEQVFISGGEPELGSWDPAGLPLTRVDDTVWSAMVDVRADRTIEFKITRGSWDTEEYRRGRIPPPNHRLSRGTGPVALHFDVERWVDEVRASSVPGVAVVT